MRRAYLIAAVLASALCTEVASASLIPPHHATVITECSQPTAVYVTTKTGWKVYRGAQALKMANKLPFNLRVESGCQRLRQL